MTDVPTDRPSASRLCTVVGLAVVTTGLAAFLLDGGGANIASAIMGLSADDWFGIAAFGAVVSFAVLNAVYGPIALAIGVAGVVLCVVVLLAGLSGLGWTRFVGLTLLESYPPIGSPVKGLGMLAVSLGLVALAYCLTPQTVPSEDVEDAHDEVPSGVVEEAAVPADGEAAGGVPGKDAAPSPNSDRVAVAVLSFFVLVVVPGWVGAAMPDRAARMEVSPAALSSAQFQRLLDMRPTAQPSLSGPPDSGRN